MLQEGGMWALKIVGEYTRETWKAWKQVINKHEINVRQFRLGDGSVSELAAMQTWRPDSM